MRPLHFGLFRSPSIMRSDDLAYVPSLRRLAPTPRTPIAVGQELQKLLDGGQIVAAPKRPS